MCAKGACAVRKPREIHTVCGPYTMQPLTTHRLDSLDVYYNKKSVYLLRIKIINICSLTKVRVRMQK